MNIDARVRRARNRLRNLISILREIHAEAETRFRAHNLHGGKMRNLDDALLNAETCREELTNFLKREA